MDGGITALGLTRSAEDGELRSDCTLFAMGELMFTGELIFTFVLLFMGALMLASGLFMGALMLASGLFMGAFTFVSGLLMSELMLADIVLFGEFCAEALESFAMDERLLVTGALRRFTTDGFGVEGTTFVGLTQARGMKGFVGVDTVGKA